MSLHDPFMTEVVKGCSPNALHDMLAIHQTCLVPYQDERAYYCQTLFKDSSIFLFLKDNVNRIGYLLAILHDDAVLELKNDDPAMTKNPSARYIESICVLPAYQRRGGGSMLLDALIEECGKRRVERITLHARVNNGFSNMTQKKFGIKPLRRIPIWPYYDSQEPAEYLEAALRIGAHEAGEPMSEIKCQHQ